MELDVASYRRVAERWSTKEEDINPSTAAVLMLQMCSEIERLQKADYEFQEKLADGITDAFLEGRWISVWEQLPALNTRVLVFVDCKPHEHPHTIGAFMFYGNWELDAEYEEATEPSYWMPLSDPPEVK